MSLTLSLPLSPHKHLLKGCTNETHFKNNLLLDELQKNSCHRLFIVNRQTTKKREQLINMYCGRLYSWGADSEVEISAGGLKCLGTRLGKTRAGSRMAKECRLPSANRSSAHTLRHSEDRLPFMTYLRGRGCWVLSPLGHRQNGGLPWDGVCPWEEAFHPHYSQKQVSSQSDLKEELGSTAELLQTQFDPQRKPHFAAI